MLDYMCCKYFITSYTFGEFIIQLVVYSIRSTSLLFKLKKENKTSSGIFQK